MFRWNLRQLHNRRASLVDNILVLCRCHSVTVVVEVLFRLSSTVPLFRLVTQVRRLVRKTTRFEILFVALLL